MIDNLGVNLMLKKLFFCLLLTTCHVVLNYSIILAQTTSNFSLPVTEDKSQYRKFDSQAKEGKYHTGDDYYNPDLKVLATSCGKIVSIINNGQDDHGFGNTIIIKHELKNEDVYSLYAHLAGFTPDIKLGKTVLRGEQIGIMGKTGSGSGNIVHLHFEIKRNSTLTNPLSFGSIKEGTQYGYALINEGKQKAISATDYGYYKPMSFYNKVVAICKREWIVVNLKENKNGFSLGRNGVIDYGSTYSQRKIIGSCSRNLTQLLISPPSPKRGLVLILCTDEHHENSGIEGFVVHEKTGLVLAKGIVPKRWALLKWVSWSPDEQYALAVAAGEITMGDMVFIDLNTGMTQKIEFKDLTRNPQGRQDRTQDFDVDKLVWINSTTFRLTLEIRCNPYESTDPSCYEKILSNYPVEITLNPLMLKYKPFH